jgi:hypothetical protein
MAYFPNAKLVIAKNRFEKGSKVIYKDKEGNSHKATVLNVEFKSLNSGYRYAIELDEPLNGQVKYLTTEKSLSSIPVEKKEKPVSDKPRKKRVKKAEGENK